MPKTKPGGAALSRPPGNKGVEAYAYKRPSPLPLCGPCVHRRPALGFGLRMLSEVADAWWTKLG
jgi:hypothetical protein